MKLTDVKKAINEYGVVKNKIHFINNVCFGFQPNSRIFDIKIVGKNIAVEMYGTTVEFPKSWLEIEKTEDLVREMYKFQEEKLKEKYAKRYNDLEEKKKDLEREEECDVENLKNEFNDSIRNLKKLGVIKSSTDFVI